MRRKHSFKVSFLIIIFLVTLLLLLPVAVNAASTNTWDFSNPSDYTYDSALAEVSGGTAHSKTLDLANGWWTKTQNCGCDDFVYGVTCDPSGNPVVVGDYYNGSNYDIWVRKYDGTDGSTLWTQTFNFGNHECAYGVSCDGSGNPVVVGYVDNGSNNDIWVRKCSSINGSELWTQTFNSGGNDEACGVSCDGSGNPIVAGYIDNGSNSDIWVCKYSSDGNTVLWTRTYNNGSGCNDRAKGISCDGNNPVVAGYIYNGSNNDIWVRKYDSSGNTTWTQTYNSGGEDFATGVSCAGGGNPAVSATVNYDIWVRKYNSSNGNTLWTQTYNGGGNDYAYGVSCDGSGNPAVVGFFDNGNNYNDIWVRKYSNSDGSTLWTQTYNGGSQDGAFGVSFDGSGNPVVAGNFNTLSGSDIWVRKYSGSDGSTIWTKTYDTVTLDYAYGVSCDPSGNPIVAGYTKAAGGTCDIWVRKYSSDGSILWTRTYNGGYGDDYAMGVSCDGSGNPVVVGHIYNGSNNDIWVRKYDGTNGGTLWTKTYNGGYDDRAYGVSCDGSGNPVVVGYVNNGAKDNTWVRKYSSDGNTVAPGLRPTTALTITMGVASPATGPATR